jgi:hypothetical protein
VSGVAEEMRLVRWTLFRGRGEVVRCGGRRAGVVHVRALSHLSVSCGATTAQALNQQRKAYCLGSRDMAERLLGHVEQQQHAGAGQQINVAVLKALLRREMEDLEGHYAAHVAAAAAVPPLAPASTEVRCPPSRTTPLSLLRDITGPSHQPHARRCGAILGDSCRDAAAPTHPPLLCLYTPLTSPLSADPDTPAPSRFSGPPERAQSCASFDPTAARTSSGSVVRPVSSAFVSKAPFPHGGSCFSLPLKTERRLWAAARLTTGGGRPTTSTGGTRAALAKLARARAAQTPQRTVR